MQQLPKIPVTLNFSGSMTYLVEAATYEGAALKAESGFRNEYPNVQIDAIIILDESEALSLIEDGRRFLELNEEPN